MVASPARGGLADCSPFHYNTIATSYVTASRCSVKPGLSHDELGFFVFDRLKTEPIRLDGFHSDQNTVFMSPLGHALNSTSHKI
jgi:hypothetical protein